MNHVVSFRPIAQARMTPLSKPARCDLQMLSGVVLSTMAPLFSRRGQTIDIEQPVQPVVVKGDLRLVSSLLSAIFFEAAGLSSAHARLRVAFDNDEGDAVVTVVGSNIHRFSLGPGALDRQMADLAEEAGAELDLLWDQEEGPTLVLRFPCCLALG